MLWIAEKNMCDHYMRIYYRYLFDITTVMILPMFAYLYLYVIKLSVIAYCNLFQGNAHLQVHFNIKTIIFGRMPTIIMVIVFVDVCLRKAQL